MLTLQGIVGLNCRSHRYDWPMLRRTLEEIGTFLSTDEGMEGLQALDFVLWHPPGYSQSPRVSNLLPPQEFKSWPHACPCRSCSSMTRGTLSTLNPLKQPAQPDMDSNCSTGLVVASFQSDVHPQAVCTEAEAAFSHLKSLFTSAPIMAHSQPSSHTARPHGPNTLSP